MTHPYFVMIYLNDHDAVPASDAEGDVIFYPSAEAIHTALCDHPFAQVLGYEIFCLGEGEQ